MILSRDEFMAKLGAIIGENSSDEALSLFEDASDTYDDLYNKSIGDGVDWKASMRKNDNAWRAKYKERFLSAPVVEEVSEVKDTTVEPKELTYENLFKEVK